MMLLLAIMYGWITYFYFPIACFLSEALPRMFHTSIISVTMVRFAMMFLAVSDLFSSTEEKRLAGVQAQL